MVLFLPQKNILYKRLLSASNDFITGCFLCHLDFVNAILHVPLVVFDIKYWFDNSSTKIIKLFIIVVRSIINL